MLRKLSILLLALFVCLSCAAADGQISTAIEAPSVLALRDGRADWPATQEDLARLTAACWMDYCATSPERTCPREALTEGALCAQHESAGFWFIVIPVGQERLTFYYIPLSGAVRYMWEGGDYSLQIKAQALLDRGMTVYRVEPEHLEDVLSGLE